MPSLAVAGTGKTLETLWRECQTESVTVVANRHNLTRQQLVAMFQQSGLAAGGNRDPSPSQIRQECRKFREKWTAEQAESRYVGSRKILRMREI
jgi:hypothetical protein